MRRLLTLLVLLVLGLVPAAGAGGSPAQGATQDYIVVLHAGTSPTAVAADHARRLGVSVGHVYRHSLRGYSASVAPAALARLEADPRVAYVERDSLVHATATQLGAT